MQLDYSDRARIGAIVTAELARRGMMHKTFGALIKASDRTVARIVAGDPAASVNKIKAAERALAVQLGVPAPPPSQILAKKLLGLVDARLAAAVRVIDDTVAENIRVAERAVNATAVCPPVAALMKAANRIAHQGYTARRQAMVQALQQLAAEHPLYPEIQAADVVHIAEKHFPSTLYLNRVQHMSQLYAHRRAPAGKYVEGDYVRERGLIEIGCLNLRGVALAAVGDEVNNWQLRTAERARAV